MLAHSIMSQSLSLVFRGEVLPGFETAAVQDALARLLGVSQQHAARLFSGEQVVLKRNLGPAEVDRYVRHLASLGARVEVASPAGPAPQPAPQAAKPAAGPELPVAAKAAARAAPAAAPPVATPLAVALVEPVEEMDCPRCGHRQPKRTLCQSCSTDMPRFLAARREAEQEERAARALTANRRADPAGRDSAGMAPSEPELVGGDGGPGWLGYSLAGRLPRLEFLAAGTVALACSLVVVLVGAKMDAMSLVYLGLTIQILLQTRLAVLRCHDIGWSGWFALISFVPIVGLVLAVILIFVPGNRSRNAFGPAARSPVGKSLFIAFAALLAVGGIGVKIGPDLARHFAREAVGDPEVLSAIANGSARFSPDNRVLFYADAACPCAPLVEQLERAGIDATLVDPVRELAGVERELLYQRLERAGIEPGSADLIVDVNGTLLVDPPVAAILGRLRIQR
jgi:uncharacterized membrane protein YhaH (DUF805 family)